MIRLQRKRSEAQDKWESLTSGAAPVIYVGAASCGRAAGAVEVLEAVRDTLREHGLDARVVEVGCIGPCYLEPLMDIRMPGRPRISYANVTAKKSRHIVESYLLREDPRLRYAVGHFGGGDSGFGDLPRFFDLPMLKPQVRVVLRNCGFVDPEDIDHYLANEGYMGILSAFAMGSDGVVDEVERAGIRGRGGAGFPTHMKWRFCKNAPEKTKYLICNADEGDPGAFMNRSLLESDPHSVLEGMLIAGYAIDAGSGYIYIRSEYPLAIARLKNAVGQMRNYGLLGTNILNSGFDFDIAIKQGAGAFVCGEETSLIASIEGNRGTPRSRPPYPASSGLYGKPTVINNVETLGTLPNILREGAAWYRGFGTQNSRGTKTFSLVGSVRRTGLIEVPLGTTLREIVFDIGGGPKKEFKGVQTGGPSGGCLSAEHLDTPVEYESLSKAGSIMGSGGLIVLDSDTCVVDLARYFLDFTQKESCGQCTPCRLGTRRLVQILERITRGKGKMEDLAKLQAIGEMIKPSALCGLGQTAPNPVLTTLRYFRDEYVSHILEHACPAHVCTDLVEYRIIDDLCTGCQRCIPVCPTEAITGSKKEPHELDSDKCVKCRACYQICPFGAITGDRRSLQTKVTNIQ
jgi:NADH-quinone oxidoreductase subunit F